MGHFVIFFQKTVNVVTKLRRSNIEKKFDTIERFHGFDNCYNKTIITNKKQDLSL